MVLLELLLVPGKKKHRDFPRCKDNRLWFWGNKLRFPSTEQSGIKGAEELMRVVSNATATDLNSHQHKLALSLGK